MVWASVACAVRRALGRLVRSSTVALTAIGLAACADTVPVDAPPPGGEAAPIATEAGPAPADEAQPAWLRGTETSQLGGARQDADEGLRSDARVKAYSGEGLTAADSTRNAPLEGSSKDILARAEARARAAGIVPNEVPAPIEPVPDPVSLVEGQFVALPEVAGYRLRLATLPNPDAAAEAWVGLVERFPDVLGDKRLFIVDLDLGYHGIHHRVEAGSYATLEEAWKACMELMRQRQGCAVGGP